MGFCLINNVAVAAAWARRELGPILIADCDYHHGNGTQAWVERELEAGTDGIGFISTHAYPAYPGSGAFGESHVEARGFVLDIPLTHQTDGETFVGVWQLLLPATVRRLRPTVIFVSAGFDWMAGDPIAGLPIGPQALPPLFSLFAATAQESGSALVFVLEGGYSLANMRAAGAALAKALCVPPQPPPPSLLRQDQVRRLSAEALRWLMTSSHR
jgi:acetoin utilization deacetylase AcuC-like enzyme